MSWGNQGNLVHSNPSINQQTEKKPSKRKAPYRPLERTEQLKRKAWWKTEAQSVKRSTLKKKEPSQVSMRTKNNLWLRTRSWVEEVPRECHMKNQLEEIGALRSAKKPPKKQEELDRKGQSNSQKKHQSGEKGTPQKEHHNHEKELGKKVFKSQRKSHKRYNRRSIWKRPKRKHSEWKEPYEMLNGAKLLSNNVTTIAGLKKAKEKAIKWSIQIGKRPYKNHSEKNRALKKILKRTTKPLRRRILIEEGLAKSSKKQHLENTDKWYLCKAYSWNANQNKTTRRAGYKKVYEPPPPHRHPKEAFRIKGALWNAEQN